MDNEDTLRMRGFLLMQKRLLWCNRELRMAFSHEAARDHDARWLREALAEQIPSTDFVFYFNQIPSDLQVCRDILNELGMPGISPQVRLATLRARGA
jgi:hypothetical protein